MNSRSSCAWLGLGLLLAGCAGRFDPANFEGSREEQRAEPEAVIDIVARTSDFETIGRVHDSCTWRPGFRRVDEEALSDLDCSTERLLTALHESAAAAGGQALVGARCDSRRVSTASRETHRLSCTAQVARYVAGPLAAFRPLTPPRSLPQGKPAPSPSDVKRIDEPDASLAFRISVKFEPAVAEYSRSLRSSAQVRELPVMPVSHQALGDLATTCADGCDERALRYGVLIAAARLGAPDVVGVRCFTHGSSNSCIGTLAAPERDE